MFSLQWRTESSPRRCKACGDWLKQWRGFEGFSETAKGVEIQQAGFALLRGGTRRLNRGFAEMVNCFVFGPARASLSGRAQKEA